MDIILAKTITGFSHYIKDIQPDMIVVHGDRVEALACAIVGSLNNILTAHIEGGEVSGTIDELIRHSVSKISHVHFVSNETAKQRLMQMGESDSQIHVIGSPDMDIMYSDTLPSLVTAKQRYEIEYDNYGILMFHPVTTEYDTMQIQARSVVDAVLASEKNYIVIYPNNDKGSDFIFGEYERLTNNERFRIFPSLRFEYFLTLLRNADFIVGNSSAGIREAPEYGVPTVNIGTRQQNRGGNPDILHTSSNTDEILTAINSVHAVTISKSGEFGKGKSDKRFLKTISDPIFWQAEVQKSFQDRWFANAMLLKGLNDSVTK